MDKIIIEGNQLLKGTVSISGAKNAVLPIMTAALLADGVSHIHKVPNLRDTRTMIRLLDMVGAKTEYKDGTLSIDARSVDTPIAPYELVKTMRASFYVLGPLVSRLGVAKVSLPGGCAWGPRPVDFHLKGLEKLGAEVTLDGGYIQAKAKRLKGNVIRFDFPSVGATGNILMASVTAEGTTIIENAAREPEIVQLAQYLNKMGANIEGIETDILTIRGVDKLHPADIQVIPDRIEAGTFLIAGAALGDVTLTDVEPSHLEIILGKLEESGAKLEIGESTINIKRGDTIKPIDMVTGVYPGFPTDLQAQWMALMTIADGSTVITDTVYKDRFSHIPELNRLGANIQLENNTAFIRGQSGLKGAPVMSTDIRASASLVLGALIAEGKTEIDRVYHLDRGYEDLEVKLGKLSAKITRVSE